MSESKQPPMEEASEMTDAAQNIAAEKTQSDLNLSAEAEGDETPLESDEEKAQDAENSAMSSVLKKLGASKKKNRELQLEEELEVTKNKMMRIAAEAENIRKRSEREKAQAHQFAIEKFAGDLLSVADNFQRAMDALSDEDRENMPMAGKNLVQGLEMVEKELQAAFQRHGLSQINPQAVAFDPTEHQAVAQIPSDAPVNQVIEIAQVGYKLNGRVLRPAMVVVSSGDNAKAAN